MALETFAQGTIPGSIICSSPLGPWPCLQSPFLFLRSHSRPSPLCRIIRWIMLRSNHEIGCQFPFENHFPSEKSHPKGPWTKSVKHRVKKLVCVGRSTHLCSFLSRLNFLSTHHLKELTESFLLLVNNANLTAPTGYIKWHSEIIWLHVLVIQEMNRPMLKFPFSKNHRC